MTRGMRRVGLAAVVISLSACSAPGPQPVARPGAATGGPVEQPAASPSRPAVPLHGRAPITLPESTEKMMPLPPSPPGGGVRVAPFLGLPDASTAVDAKQLKALERLLARTPPRDAEFPDLLLRLANSHDQSGRFWRAHGRADMADAHEKRALASYKKLLSAPASRTYRRADEALFFFAHALQRRGLAIEARKVFHRLIKEHPRSKHVPSAYLSFADYYFQNKSYANAERFYAKVAMFRKAPAYAYARYMLGRTYAELQQPHKALEAFVLAAQAAQGSPDHDRLRRAAVHRTVGVYRHAGDPAKAYAFFRRVAPDATDRLAAMLAAHYARAGMASAAAMVWRKMVARGAGDDVSACVLYSRLAAIEAPHAGLRSQLPVIEKLIAVRRRLPKQAADSECAVTSRVAMAKTARAWHREMNHRYDHASSRTILELADAYLDLAVYASPTDREQMMLLGADVAWRRAELEPDAAVVIPAWHEAASRFERLADLGGASADIAATAKDAARLARENADRLSAGR